MCLVLLKDKNDVGAGQWRKPFTYVGRCTVKIKPTPSDKELETSIELHSCNVCWALIQTDDMGKHAVWHIGPAAANYTWEVEHDH